MHVPLTSSTLSVRNHVRNQQGSDQKSGSSNTGVYIGIGVALGVFVLIYSIYAYLRYIREGNRAPRYVSTSFLKDRWRAWSPKSRYGRVSKDNGSSTHTDGTVLETTTVYAPSIEVSAPNASTSDNATNVDRHTSVRSVMTLPPYRPSPHHDEQLIAREGERAGVDTVIEYPETEAELEARREEEMETLFQIRQARRREIQEREERRRARREAREAGDWARLEQLRLESQMRARAESAASIGPSAGNSTTSLPNSDFLIAELALQREGHRERRVSSVSYAELGLARHDGSRIRADSVESDNRPLLDSAASMGGHHSRNHSRQASQQASRTNSPFRPPAMLRHQRDFSNGSILTVDSDTPDTPRTSTHGTQSGSGDEPLRLTPYSSPDTPNVTNNGTNNSAVPGIQPPRYEDDIVPDHREYAELDGQAPPGYTSPVRARGDGVFRLPSLRPLPSIEIEGATPRNSVATTPVDGHLETSIRRM